MTPGEWTILVVALILSNANAFFVGAKYGWDDSEDRHRTCPSCHKRCSECGMKLERP